MYIHDCDSTEPIKLTSTPDTTMSYIAIITGSVVYPTKQIRDNVLETLRDKGWVSDKISPQDISVNGDAMAGICIEYGSYRNLGRNLDLLTDAAEDWIFIQASTDGIFTGYVNTQDVAGEEEINLNEFAKETETIGPSPDEEDYSSHDEWHDNYTSWQSNVQNTFIATQREQYSGDLPHPT